MIKKIFKVPITNYPPKIRDFRGLNPRNFSEIPEGQLLTTNKGLTLLEMAISMVRIFEQVTKKGVSLLKQFLDFFRT